MKARITEITQLLVKYGIDSAYFNTSELETMNNTINTLLEVIQKLIQLPLCTDCRCYTQEEVYFFLLFALQRREILKLLPASYQSQFENIEPRKMEEIAKPLDEKCANNKRK